MLCSSCDEGYYNNKYIHILHATSILGCYAMTCMLLLEIERSYNLSNYPTEVYTALIYHFPKISRIALRKFTSIMWYDLSKYMYTEKMFITFSKSNSVFAISLLWPLGYRKSKYLYIVLPI